MTADLKPAQPTVGAGSGESGPRAASPAFRPELQALRALAVAAVVVYHLWPKHLPGGFVGVDVFFVLSGYLISAHLIREIDRTGTVVLRQFWARRIRRLLPASFSVLIVSTIALVLFLPQSIWVQSLTEIRAAGLYVENWLLAFNSVDYLAAENDPSLVQHFWSLSVEEQFYLVWPLLFVAAAWIARRRGLSPLRAILTAVVVIVGASLVFSIVLSYTAPGPAYFVTTTRAWEFAAGGLLAALAAVGVRMPAAQPARIAASWAGLALIVVAIVTFSGDTVFPGWAALIPVVGTVLVISAGQIDHPAAPTFYGRWRPVQWVGDVSYSVYLWHWPVLIVATQLVDRMNVVSRLSVIVITLLLAYLTKKFIEDPVRTRRFWVARLAPAYTLLVVGMALIVVVTSVGIGVVGAQQTQLAEDAKRVAKCLGASALNPDIDCDGVVAADALFPALASVAGDSSLQYSCYTPKGEELKTCEYGDETSDVRIAIVGDSHASSFLPGLINAANRSHWLVTTFVGNGCRLGFPQSCAAGPAIQEALAEGDFDIVLAAGLRKNQPEVERLVAAWQPLVEQGMPIVPVVDVPSTTAAARDCIDNSGGVYSVASACGTDRDVALTTYPDSFGAAGAALGLDVIDFTDIMCTSTECPSVIGHVIVYRDASSHIISTFSATLRWAWEAQLTPLVP